MKHFEFEDADDTPQPQEGTTRGFLNIRKRIEPKPQEQTPQEQTPHNVEPQEPRRTISELAMEHIREQELQKIRHTQDTVIPPTQQQPIQQEQPQPYVPVYAPSPQRATSPRIVIKPVSPQPTVAPPSQHNDINYGGQQKPVESALPLKPSEQLTVKKGLFSRLFHRKPKVAKVKEVKVDTIQPAPQDNPKKSMYRVVDIAILLFAFVAGSVSVVLVYSELPTHPYLIIGIAGISVSVGIITGINRW